MSSEWTNRDLIIPYAAPYFAYVGLSSFFHNKIPVEINYVLKLIIVTGLLIWAWRWYFPVAGPKNRWGSVGYGVVFGVVGLVLWVVCYQPFAGEGGEPWSDTGFYLRLVTASLVVPVFEELLMRGYIFRFALQWDRFRKQKHTEPFSKTLETASVFDIEPGGWSIAAIMISSVIFALGHTTGEWPAGIVYGVLMCALYIIRKDLISCMVAHGTTNFGLALYVFYTGHWELW
ncbi:MAG: CPBP family intramembrane metalloprotease [Desulfobacter sp.]|nr:MAG: CPBP family intramembrane metalloprotease [Desulfobacter sp.]